MAAVVTPEIGFFKKHKKAIIGLSILFVCVILALAIGLAFGLKTNITYDGEQASSTNNIEYVPYDMKPIGNVVFTELECEACTSILNLKSTGVPKDFTNTKVGNENLIILDANLIITNLVVQSADRPIMFYGNAKDMRIVNKAVMAFIDYYRHDRPFFLNFTEIKTGFWKLQCDFLSTFIDANLPAMLIQLCIFGKGIVSVKASISDVNPAIKSSLIKHRIFAKNGENVIVIDDSDDKKIRNAWVTIVCPTAEICSTSCTICKTTVPDYRNRKSVTGELRELSVEGVAFGKVPYGSGLKTIPGTAFLLMGDMVLTRVVIQSTIMPTMVEIITDSVVGETLVPIPINFVKNTEGMWEWDVDIVYNHLRRKIYLQSSDEVTATMTMYYIEPEYLPFETADFIRKKYIAQRNNTFLENMVFTDCRCT